MPRADQGQIAQRRGQQPAPAAQEQGPAENILKLGQRLGHGGLADAGGRRHARQRTVLGDVGQQDHVAAFQAVGQTGGIPAHGFLYNQTVIELCQQR
ncbi:hypothetical protein D3C87_1923470 [compost metagenome]